MENTDNFKYYQKYLKYKSKYLELKKLIGGAITPDEIQREWTASGNTVTYSEGQDGWFLSWGTKKDNMTHIHLYSDGSYTYKVKGTHIPSNEYAADCHFYTIYYGHRPDSYGCRIYEPTSWHPTNAKEWIHFLMTRFNELWKSS